MSNGGRGGNNRGNRKKPFKHRNRENAPKNTGKRPADFSPVSEGKPEKKRNNLIDRPKWVPPSPPSVPLPAATCAWCDKPIKDISTAISEPDTGKAVHFDCIINRLVEREDLESGDTVGYIGGGRFGIIHFNNPPDTRDFKIKKIFEWENREIRADWRVTMSEHFSTT